MTIQFTSRVDNYIFVFLQGRTSYVLDLPVGNHFLIFLRKFFMYNIIKKCEDQEIHREKL